ncbi:class I SAM-dependent DNA methyltransferase [Nitrosomonas sp.]|uniref:class I SAM-dependent DNA methyltransferase n=1 Tax=Nitrosomonas sp. TaxID=42353 RepID=UPI0025D00276|nr:DNA methyltransferase [Nitrosomonas sp.]
MNAVEIEQAITSLANAAFDRENFPYDFLAAFGNKDITLKRLRAGVSNKSDLGGVLQTNNIHIAVAPLGAVTTTLTALRASPATTRYKAKFILATDGETLEAEELDSGDTIACTYPDFPDHFGFFLPLAGISIVRQIRDNAFDIRATSRLNRLYIELLKDNPDWGNAERRPEMNHFMARLIFCFFAEDTDIFRRSGLFTATVEQMSARDASNTHAVISEIFRAMNTAIDQRSQASLPRWADIFPYVNGGLFSGSVAVPCFSRIARSYLLHIGQLDWTQINPDIFGSMIQAVADDEERGALGMHYTSVPNILKVLNPLFLDDLREKLEEAGDNKLKLLNLRKRLARIRVFDPACGSGNFLVIAYKQLREIEHAINERRDEKGQKSDIPLTNFRGIELRGFSAEIARLALIIAEYQCNVRYLGQREALAVFLPLSQDNWITCGNALRLDWLSLCPPTGTRSKQATDDLFAPSLEHTPIDFENEGGETYICGNPPYKGSQSQDNEQKADLEAVFKGTHTNWKGVDYVGGWFLKAARYCQRTTASFAFVSTNSICQGKAVASLWPSILGTDLEICFAYTSFKWTNLASYNAGVTVVIVGVAPKNGLKKRLFVTAFDNSLETREVNYINAYLVSGPEIYVEPRNDNLSGLSSMAFGNMAIDGGFLSLTREEIEAANIPKDISARYIRKIYGAAEYIRGLNRYCLWVSDPDVEFATENQMLRNRLAQVQKFRRESKRPATRELADQPHRFGWTAQTGDEVITILPRILSERREYITVGQEPAGTLTTDQAYALYNAPLWNMAIIASRLHLVWIATVCGKLKTDFRYSNTLGWNTFPVPTLTEKNKADLIRCAEDILLAREAHFPATIADLYNPDTMPDNLRTAHDHNDEVLERIYIGRRFKNDTERLEKLFDLYTKMAVKQNKKTTSPAVD